MFTRENTKKIKISNLTIGGDNNILIQSMCNTKTKNIDETVNQILKLEKYGCEIIRVSIPDEESAKAIDKIKQKIHIPLVGDIHFDHKLALMAIENGIDKIRINPGNIGSIEKIKEVCKKANEYNIPIRVGVNSGSVEKNILEKYNNKITEDALVESAINNIKILEDCNFNNIVISIKASDAILTYKSYKLLATKTSYPLHVGITEAGTLWSGNIKSSIGLALILNEGIGDTVRVSLSADPIEEIKTAKMILKTLGIRKNGIELISCPTCARTNIDIISLAKQVEDILYEKFSDKNIKVAVMGCAVNGPGEAKNADIGIAGGINEAVIFKKGIVIKKVPEDKIIKELVKEIETY